MQQVVDLQESQEFTDLDVQLVSLSPDPVESWASEGQKMGIMTPTLSDPENQVWGDYGSLEWTMGTGEPGHTFFLVSDEGQLIWLRDYGAPASGGSMYVEPSEIVQQVRDALDAEG
jgi:peroxiredoxin